MFILTYTYGKFTWEVDQTFNTQNPCFHAEKYMQFVMKKCPTEYNHKMILSDCTDKDGTRMKQLSENHIAVALDKNNKIVQFCMVVDDMDCVYLYDHSWMYRLRNREKSAPYEVLYWRFAKAIGRIVRRNIERGLLKLDNAIIDDSELTDAGNAIACVRAHFARD